VDFREDAPYVFDAMSSATEAGHPIVIFDGECNFCDASVSFIIDRDPAGIFRFAARQSPEGKRVMREHGIPEKGLDSMILVEDARVFVRSTAGLRIAKRLRGAWPVLYAFVAVPGPLRDAIYNVIAKNRKRLMGASDACAVPTPARRARFLSA
jgi:predicted DCC family thiol-disulfide oxidoreductase YuxK